MPRRQTVAMLGMISLAAISACLVTIDRGLIGVFPDAGLDAACVRVSNDAGPVVIVSGLEGAEHLAVDPRACGEGLVFWTTGNCDADGGVFAASKDGGQSRSIASGPCDIATSASHVAWAGYAFVGIAQIDAGSPQRIAAAEGVYHVAVHGGFVFWANTYGPGIHRARIEDVSCPSCQLIETASGAFGIAVDESSVYWTELDSYNGQSSTDASVRAASHDGSNVRLVDRGRAYPRLLALARDRIYWRADNELRSAPRSGGAATTLVPNVDAQGLVVAGDRLYWTEPNVVRSCDLDGRNVRTEAEGQEDPVEIAADGDAVYWVNRKAGTIVRLDR